ncbi:hypothetical protein CS542_05580 [Pedobacter sp. IW39]|nr:hypothetical protein CS542_05580 [Pedobacter sp. IW39]
MLGFAIVKLPYKHAIKISFFILYIVVITRFSEPYYPGYQFYKIAEVLVIYAFIYTQAFFLIPVLPVPFIIVNFIYSSVRLSSSAEISKPSHQLHRFNTCMFDHRMMCSPT